MQNKDKFDLISFRYTSPNIYWSLIFYFELNKIDKSFMLPYTNFDSNIAFENKLDENIINIKKKEENGQDHNVDLKVKKNFNFKNIFYINENEIKKYDTDDLCIQNVYNLGLIDNLLYSYKNILDYEDNIGYNQLPLILFEEDLCSPITKRSSIMIFNENENYNNFLFRDSIPLYKRSSELNFVVTNFNSLLRITRNEPVDNHLLIKKKNPLEDRIFDFESSVDLDDDEDTDDIVDSSKKN
jgi:hypothetical protein